MVGVTEFEREGQHSEPALARCVCLCGCAESDRILDFQPESPGPRHLPRGCAMPGSQRDKLRNNSLPLLGNDVADLHLDGGHLRHPVRRMDCSFDVVTSTAGPFPDSNVNLYQYAGTGCQRAALSG